VGKLVETRVASLSKIRRRFQFEISPIVICREPERLGGFKVAAVLPM